VQAQDLSADVETESKAAEMPRWDGAFEATEDSCLIVP
jgi:hypothetical protein